MRRKIEIIVGEQFYRFMQRLEDDTGLSKEEHAKFALEEYANKAAREIYGVRSKRDD